MDNLTTYNKRLTDVLLLSYKCLPLNTLQDAWIKFIRKLEPLQWFCTFTFREQVHPEQADRRYKRFIHQVNEFYFGKRYREKGLGAYHVRALEMQRRGVIHFHSLIGGAIKPEHRFYFMESWNRDNGFARIFPYNPKGAPGYVSKYVVKGGELDIFIPLWKQEELKTLSESLSFSLSPPKGRGIDWCSRPAFLQG